MSKEDRPQDLHVKQQNGLHGNKAKGLSPAQSSLSDCLSSEAAFSVWKSNRELNRRRHSGNLLVRKTTVYNILCAFVPSYENQTTTLALHMVSFFFLYMQQTCALYLVWRFAVCPPRLFSDWLPLCICPLIIDPLQFIFSLAMKQWFYLISIEFHAAVCSLQS